MAYLITGGCGFIGSYTIRALLNQGEEVVAYDWAPEGNVIQKILSREELSKVKIVPGDVGDIAHLIHTAKQFNVSQIIHLAYLLIPESNANPLLAIKVNCEGTNNVFEVARILGLKKVVWASSTAVFGSPDQYEGEYLPDNAPHYPKSVYGACKSLNEYMANYYFENLKVNNVGLRFSLTYGPGRLRGATAFIMELLEKPALNKPGIVPCGDDEVNLLYVEDAARAILLACKAEVTKIRVFNTGGDLCPIKEAADYVRGLIPGANITLEPGTFGIKWKYNITQVEKEVGFKPRHSWKEGIKRTINYFRQQQGLPLIGEA